MANFFEDLYEKGKNAVDKGKNAVGDLAVNVGHEVAGVFGVDSRGMVKDGGKGVAQGTAGEFGDQTADAIQSGVARIGLSGLNPAQGADPNDIKYLDQLKLSKELTKGQDAGTKLTGFTAGEIGARNRGLSNRIFDELNQPSIGANRLAEQGAARLSQLVASQAQQGVTGGMAQAQRMQLQRQTARDVAGQAQTDYQNALDRVTAKQKSDAGTFAGLMGTDAQLGAAMQMETKKESKGLLGF